MRPYDRSDRNKDRRSRRPKGNQPADFRQGIHSALQLVKDVSIYPRAIQIVSFITRRFTVDWLSFQGLGETAEKLVRVASVEHESKGKIGIVGGVLREIPPTAIRPIILASQATTNVLDGVRSQLVPDARAELALKWRSDYFWNRCLLGELMSLRWYFRFLSRICVRACVYVASMGRSLSILYFIKYCKNDLRSTPLFLSLCIPIRVSCFRFCS